MNATDFSTDRSRIIVIHATPIWLPRTQTWMYNQANFLPDRIDTHIVCEQTANLSVFDHPNIHSFSDLPIPARLVDRALRKLQIRRNVGHLARVSRNLGAQIVHSHFGMSAWRNMEEVDRAGALHVVSFYGADVTQTPLQDPANPKRYKTLFAQVDAVFCEGNVMARRIADLGCDERKIAVHHLGVDLDDFPFRPRRWRSDEPLRVLLAATFREKKGLTYGIKALGAIRDRVDLDVTIIGDATSKPGDQDEKSLIMTSIEEAGLSDCTTMLGFQSHARLIEEAYRHHVFMSPSVTAGDGDTEGGAPVSIIEMAASGMPVVSTLHCDIPEVILADETGWLAPERDWQALASHLEWLIEHPDDWLATLERGRAHILREYDCRKQGERLADHYERLLG